MNAPILLEEKPRRQKPERHAVAAIAKREQMTRIPAMPADIGQAVGRRREESFPRERGFNVRESRVERLESASNRPDALVDSGATARAASARDIAPTEHQPAIARPPRI